MSKIRVGDNIVHKVYGDGMIEFISKNRYSKLPVRVHFAKRKTYGFFTKNGHDYINGPMKMIHW